MVDVDYGFFCLTTAFYCPRRVFSSGIRYWMSIIDLPDDYMGKGEYGFYVLVSCFTAGVAGFYRN